MELLPASVLIVEHDGSVRSGLAFALRDAGLAVREASDGTDARRELEGLCPHAALVDLHLADQQSFALIAWMRQTCPRMTVVVATTDDRPARWRLAREAGAHALMIKPFAASALLAVMRSAVAGLQGG